MQLMAAEFVNGVMRVCILFLVQHVQRVRPILASPRYLYTDEIRATRTSLYLDPSIRDWVLFPISLVMVRLRVFLTFDLLTTITLLAQILVGVLRHYVLLLLQNKPKPQTRPQIREQYVHSSLYPSPASSSLFHVYTKI
jgi:hypothetical protein